MHTIFVACAGGDGVGVDGVSGEVRRRLECRDAVGGVVSYGARHAVHEKGTGVDACSVHVVAELHKDSAVGADEVILRGGDHHGSAAVHHHGSAGVLRNEGRSGGASSAAGCDQDCAECDAKE